MYSTLISAIITLALSSRVQAAPLQNRQDTSLILADTVQFIAKTIGTNPDSSVLPDVNNWLAIPVHAGATENLWTLTDPSTSSFDLTAPGIFRNGTDSDTMYLTAGDIIPNEPFSVVFGETHQNGSSNPGAEQGFVGLDVGTGTQGIDVIDGQLAVGYAEDFFYACPNVAVEGAEVVAVSVIDRYANPPSGCWQINLYAQCAGSIADSDRAAFPEFQQASCYANATVAAGTDY